MSRRDQFIAERISEFADKFGITNEQAIRIVHNVGDINELWEIVGLEDFIHEVAERYNIKL